MISTSHQDMNHCPSQTCKRSQRMPVSKSEQCDATQISRTRTLRGISHNATQTCIAAIVASDNSLGHGEHMVES